MKTNVSISTNDEEKLAIGLALGLKRAVMRKELREEIQEHVNNLIREGEKIKLGADPAVEAAPAREPAPERDRGVREFVPSRGDEPYLYSPEDPELATVCTSLLDAVEFIQGYAWDALERNRK